ncbi:hypothetical protein CHUAL_001766 [Chamberlinius hualienensis]
MSSKRFAREILLFMLWFLNYQSFYYVNGQSDCLRCDDFNRVNKEEVTCATSFHDCSDCKPGFIQDLDDERICFALEILDISDNIAVATGSNKNQYLSCKFNSKVNCHWTKDNKDIDIINSNGYEWVTNGGVDTEDCSIHLQKLNDNEVGKWVCSNKADSNVNSVQSNPISIYITSNVLVRPKSKYETKAGNTVEIPCTFDHSGLCSWMKNGFPIKPSTNYQYSDKNTKNCTLKIISVDQAKDSTEWKCSRPGDSNTPAVVAGITQIDVLPAEIETYDQDPKILVLDNEVIEGKLITLKGDYMWSHIRCRSHNAPLLMTWIINGNNVFYQEPILSQNEIGISSKLQNIVISHLQNQNKVELTCSVKYHEGEMKTTNVFLVQANEQPHTVKTANLNIYIIALLALLVLILFIFIVALIGGLIYFFCHKKTLNYSIVPASNV